MNLKVIIDKSRLLWSILSSKERIVIISLATFIIITITLSLFINRVTQELSVQKNRYNEFLTVSEQYKNLKINIETIEKREGLTKPKSILEFVYNQFDELGLKKKIKSVKSLGSKEIKDYYVEEPIDITAENMTMNELVNLLFKLERAPMMLSVKSLSIRKSFENPERLNLQLTVSRFSKK
ncbi:MAG TPA: hypothetical protein HPP56_03750 [Nitrospirae bacterium]|nr:hypothetical protein [Nitrospirota bacterium]